MNRPVFLWVFSCLFLFTASAQLTREANTTLAMPQTPRTQGYVLRDAFTTTFTTPVAIVTPPGESNRLFIVEKDSGRIRVCADLNAATPTWTTFLDIRARVQTGGEQGLLGLAFHPNYAQNGYFYVFYTASAPLRDRLSRFTATSPTANTADPNSELILLDQADEAGNHNGGDIHFGPDGYLYVSLGDEGGGGDQYANSQRITKDFFAGIIRIDVDKRPANLMPNRHAAIMNPTDPHYRVPADNPFVGATAFNGLPITASAVRTEFWATGLRNPWRMSFDPVTGALWCGDVGQSAREEIDIITRGGNYGWNYREGTIAYTGTPPPGFTHINPVFDYGRGLGISVTGGVVYRGSRLSQLYGAYIFGDYGAGNLWQLRLNAQGSGVATLLSASPLTGAAGVAGFGVDPRNGDILLANVNDGRIRRLDYSATATGTPIPAMLADTGAFSDLLTLSPNAGVEPYEINLPFWSDGATKRRWFSIPDVNLKAGFRGLDPWTFPNSTVFVKHFEIQTNDNPVAVRRLETRFIVKNASGVYGVTYRWDSDSNATLVPEAGRTEDIVITEAGANRTQTWIYPSRAQCLACHNQASSGVLGFNTAQLNRDVTHGAETSNQIRQLAAAGYLNTDRPEGEFWPALARPDQTEVSQEFRVRSYLEANCANCHRPGGPALGNFDARLKTPTEQAGLIRGALINNMGDENNRVFAPGAPEDSIALHRISIRGANQMPPIGSTVPDPAGVELLRAWILGDMPNRKFFPEWQAANFTDPAAAEAAAGADPDGDGGSNLLEFHTATNPREANPAWSITGAVSGSDQAGEWILDGNVLLHFLHPHNRNVVLEQKDALEAPWSMVSADRNRPFFPAAPTQRAVPVPAEGAARYFRARIVEP